MANRTLTVTLPEETVRLLEAAIASGEFFSPSDVIQTAIERLCTTEEDFDDWIRREALPVLDAMEADPSSGFTADQVRAELKKANELALRRAG